MVGHEELGPVHDFVVVSGLEGVALEGERLFEIGELLVAEAGGFAERSGGAHPADGVVLVGESALEGHEDVAALLDVVGDFLEQRVVGDVERGDDEHLVAGEVGVLGKDEVAADVGVVERVVELADEADVVCRGEVRVPGYAEAGARRA